jgi:hypothetical protein
MSVKDTDTLLGPIPEQWKPENQNPNVAYVEDMQTGVRTPLAVPEAEAIIEDDEKPKRKGGRPKKAVEEPVEEAAPVEEPVEETPVQVDEE